MSGLGLETWLLVWKDNTLPTRPNDDKSSNLAAMFTHIKFEDSAVYGYSWQHLNLSGL